MSTPEETYATAKHTALVSDTYRGLIGDPSKDDMRTKWQMTPYLILHPNLRRVVNTKAAKTVHACYSAPEGVPCSDDGSVLYATTFCGIDTSKEENPKNWERYLTGIHGSTGKVLDDTTPINCPDCLKQPSVQEFVRVCQAVENEVGAHLRFMSEIQA